MPPEAILEPQRPLRALRLARGWSQGYLARRAGLSVATVCQLERGRRRPRPRTGRAVLRALGLAVSRWEVFGG